MSGGVVATAESLAEELGVLPDEVRMVVSEAVDLHYEEIPGWIADEVRATLSPAGERALPPSHVDAAMAYRERPDDALLRELQMGGFRLVAHALLMERLLPAAQAEVYAVAIDEWMVSGAPPYVQPSR